MLETVVELEMKLTVVVERAQTFNGSLIIEGGPTTRNYRADPVWTLKSASNLPK